MKPQRHARRKLPVPGRRRRRGPASCSPRSSTTTTRPSPSRPRRWPTCARRKIDDPEAIDALPPRLRQPHPRLPAARPSRPRRAEPSGAASSASASTAPSGHEHLAGSLVVPVIDPDGAVTELYGRKIGADLRAGHARPPLPARPAPGRVERGGPGRRRGDRLRVAHRRAHLLLRRVSPTSPPPTAPPASPPTTTRPSPVTGSPASSSPTTTTPPATRRPSKLAAELMASGHRVLPGRLPLRRRRQRRGRSAARPARRARAGRCARPSGWARARGTRRPGASPQQPLDADAAPARRSPTSRARPGIESCRGAIRGTRTDGRRPTPLPCLQLPVSPASPPQPARNRRSSHDELVIEMGPRRWRVRHIPKAPTPGVLRVNVMVGVGRALPRRHGRPLLGQAARRLRRGRRQRAASRPRHARRPSSAGCCSPPRRPRPRSPRLRPSRRRCRPMTSSRTRATRWRCSSSPDLMDAGGRRLRDARGGRRADGALAAWLTLTSRLSDRPLGAVIQSSLVGGQVHPGRRRPGAHAGGGDRRPTRP